MEDNTKNKIKAAGKMVFGAYEITSGVLMGTGHGIVGSYLKSHNMIATGRVLGQKAIQKGQKIMSEGYNDWKSIKD